MLGHPQGPDADIFVELNLSWGWRRAARADQIRAQCQFPDGRRTTWGVMEQGDQQQVVRTLTAADEGLLVQHRVLICDRDTTWSAPVRARLEEAGIRVVQTPYQAPNANAYAERFVRSITQECLNRVIPFGERPLRRTIAEYVEHYQWERNHQGIENALIGEAYGGRTGDQYGWPGSSASAARRTAQLLLSRGVVGPRDQFDGSAHEGDITGFDEVSRIVKVYKCQSLFRRHYLHVAFERGVILLTRLVPVA